MTWWKANEWCNVCRGYSLQDHEHPWSPLIVPLPLKTEPCPFCGTGGRLTPEELKLHQAAPNLRMDEYIIPAFAQMLRFVRLALAGEKTLHSQARFMAEKLLEYGFPKQSGYLMDVVEGKGEIIHAKETIQD